MRNSTLPALIFLCCFGVSLKLAAELTEPSTTSTPAAAAPTAAPELGDLCVTKQENAGGILKCTTAKKQPVGGECKCADTANLSTRKVPGTIQKGLSTQDQKTAATILQFPMKPANDNTAVYLCVDGVTDIGDFRILCQKNGRTISSHFSVMECNAVCGKL